MKSQENFGIKEKSNENFVRKAKRAFLVLSAAAAIMAPEANAGGTYVPKTLGGGEGIGYNKRPVEMKQQHANQYNSPEETNSSILINEKPGKIIFKNDRGTVYGDENTQYHEDKDGNSSLIGGVYKGE